MIYLHKILPVFFSPILIGLLVAVVGAYCKNRRLVLAACFSLYAVSTPIVAESFFKLIEYQSSKASVHSIPKTDAIVVLSGMLNDVVTDEGISVEWNDAVDRFFGGVALYSAGKANQLIFTAGHMPWSVSTRTEGDELKKLAVQYGVPANNIRLTSVVRNTADEAVEVKKILGTAAPKVVLVTSAFHMGRAKALFERQGITVIPYCVDFRASPKKLTLMDFLPDARSLPLVEIAIRELIGKGYYAIRDFS